MGKLLPGYKKALFDELKTNIDIFKSYIDINKIKQFISDNLWEYKINLYSKNWNDFSGRRNGACKEN